VVCAIKYGRPLLGLVYREHIGVTAAGTPLNQWFAIYDQSLNKLAVTCGV